MLKEQQYKIQNGGRVKMAGGSVDTYYHCAEPTIVQGASGASETARRFKELREKPSLPLLLAFFPDNPKSIKQRIRGAGLYRHLRMDQGPGGNFTAFQISENGAGLNYALTNEQGFAVLEYPVQEQINTGQFGCLVPLIQEIQTAFQHNDYRKTAQLVDQFQLLSAQVGLSLPNGEQVGSKTGFFFIRPIETNIPTEFPLQLIPDVQERVRKSLVEPESLAEYARNFIHQGYSYHDALTQAEHAYQEHGPTDYSGSGLLYFQPDCFVANDGSIEVEKVNMPDVGFFLTQIDTQGNQPLERVVEVNKRLKGQVEEVLGAQLTMDHVTLVTRDEVLSSRSDTLELLEIQALRESLERMDKTVEVMSLSGIQSADTQTQLVLLNIPTNHPDYGTLTTKVIQEDITCFPDPLLKVFQDRATTLRKIELSGKRLDKFLDLIKPKDITPDNAAHLQAEIFKYLEIAGITEDIVYVSFEGINTPVPVFRYSLHSFFQIFNALERQSAKGGNPEKLFFSPVPFSRESAVFNGQDGPRLSAFRFMFTR